MKQLASVLSQKRRTLQLWKPEVNLSCSGNGYWFLPSQVEMETNSILQQCVQVIRSFSQTVVSKPIQYLKFI
jgi:hypothetical protein